MLRNGAFPEGSLAGEGLRLTLESALAVHSSREPYASLLVRSRDGRVLWRNSSFCVLEAELDSNCCALSRLFTSVAAPCEGELCEHGGKRLHWRMLPFQWPAEADAQLWIFEDVSQQVSIRQALEEAQGKLRLLYEANPLAFICEQAGGAAIDGKTRVLDIQATELHQRVPLFIGSKNDVDLALRTYAHHSELVGA